MSPLSHETPQPPQAHPGEPLPPPGERVTVRRPLVVPSQPPVRPPQILVVDDEEIIRAALEGFLKRLGHRVSAAASGPEALELARAQSHLDLVILDVIMPGMDGLETLSRLREALPDLPALIITGFIDAPLSQRLASLPNLQVLRKPFGLADLSEALAGLLR